MSFLPSSLYITSSTMNISQREESFPPGPAWFLCVLYRKCTGPSAMKSYHIIPVNNQDQWEEHRITFFYLLGNICQSTKSKWHVYNEGPITRRSYVVQDGLELYVLLSNQVARTTLNFWSSNLSFLSTKVEDMHHYFWFVQCWRKIEPKTLWAISMHSTKRTVSLTSSCPSC